MISSQGVTVAAQSAITLSRCLEEAFGDAKKRKAARTSLEAFSKSYVSELYRSLDNSWNLAAASDLRFPSTVVSSNIDNSQMSRFDRIATDGLLERAQKDPKLYLKLLEVAHFTRPVKELTKDLYVLSSLFKAILPLNI